MADGNGAAIDVQPVIGNAELVGAIDHLAGKGFVQLPQIDVLHFQAVPFEQARHCIGRTDSHFVRLAAGRREPSENT